MVTKQNKKQRYQINTLKIKLRIGEGTVQGIKSIDKRLYMTISLVSPLLKLYFLNTHSLRKPTFSKTL